MKATKKIADVGDGLHKCADMLALKAAESNFDCLVLLSQKKSTEKSANGYSTYTSIAADRIVGILIRLALIASKMLPETKKKRRVKK